MSNLTFPPGPSLFAPLQPSANKTGVAIAQRLGIAPMLAPDEELRGGHFVRVRGIDPDTVPFTTGRARTLPTEADFDVPGHGITPPFAEPDEVASIAWLRAADNTIDLRGWGERPHGPPHQLAVTMQRNRQVPNSAGSVHVRVALFGFYQRRDHDGGSDPARWAPLGVSKLIRENVATVFDLRDSTWNALPCAFALVAFLPMYERDSWQGCLEFFACCPVRLR